MDAFITYAVDFEGSLSTGILEYGCVGIHSRQGIFSAKTGFCKNRTAIPQTECAVHHLQAITLMRRPDFATTLPYWIQLRQKAFFCAHNAAFENALLLQDCPVVFHAHTLAGMPTQNVWGPWLDTYALYKKHVPNAPGTLKELIQACGLQSILTQLAKRFCPPRRCDYHCALYDALACALLLLRFMRLPAMQSQSLCWLLQESAPAITADALRQPSLFVEHSSNAQAPDR